jgi:hypothetical protein
MSDVAATATMWERLWACYQRANHLDWLYRTGQLHYVFGGCHGILDWRDPARWTEFGVDCSSGLSIVYDAGGMVAKPRATYALNTIGFESYGDPGPGAWNTIWVLDIPAMLALPQHAELAKRLEAVGETHHCVAEFHAKPFANRFWQATHDGGPVGWVGFDTTGFHAHHWPNS